MKTSRRKFTTEFKAKVCIEAIREQQTIESLSKKHDLHPTQINTWKKEFLNNAHLVFEKEGTPTENGHSELVQSLYAQIGELKVANGLSKKKLS
jgi:transposase-like protein